MTQPGSIENLAGLKRQALQYAALLLALPAAGAGDVQVATQTLSAVISPAARVSMPANVTLTASGTNFGDLAGSLLVNYWARTSDGGSGSVTLQANSDFTPAGGPVVAAVSYYCSGATLGTACSGNQTLQTTSQTPVASLPGSICTGGGGACSPDEPNTVQLQFTAPNKPQYQTGSYSVQVTVTISAL